MRLPRIPIVRWLTTLSLLWFVWLVVSEGSVRRAMRRATTTIRALPARAMRVVSSARPATDAVISAATTAGARAATALDVSVADSAGSAATDSNFAFAPVAEIAGKARNATDTLGRARAPADVDDNARRTALVNAESLLRLSPSASDSATAYVRIAKAHRALEENRAACASLASARRLGGGDAVRGLESQFDCAP